jgi:uncharacterized SAM-binding protein YcdF (DUF218 family)
MFSRFLSKIFTPLESHIIHSRDGGCRKHQLLFEDRGKVSPFLKGFILLIIIFLLVILFSHQYILEKIGYFLIFEQRPLKADVIVALNGRDTERSLAAADLYNNGFANLIVLSKGFEPAGDEELRKRVNNGFKNRKIFFQWAIEGMGVPKESFKLIGDGVTSTYDEAKITKQFLETNGYKSILLVTSKWHSKRAYLTFQSVLNKKEIRIKIIVIPSSYDNFDPGSWWNKEEDAELVFREYVRLFYYVVTLRISPFGIIFPK